MMPVPDPDKYSLVLSVLREAVLISFPTAEGEVRVALSLPEEAYAVGADGGALAS